MIGVAGAGFWTASACASVIIAALAWHGGRALQRRLGLSRDARGYWMALWMSAVLIPAGIIMLQLFSPSATQALPSLPGLAELPLPVPILAADATTEHASAAATSIAFVLASGLLLVWLSGMLLSMSRLLYSMHATRRLVRAASPLEAHDIAPGLARTLEALTSAGILVRVTGHAMTPFAVRWPHPTVVVPAAALRQFTPRQLCLVLRHEAAHLHQRDPQRAAAMAIVGALFWFNPFVRRIAAEVQLAAELRCDAHALRQDPAGGHAFASAYLATLRMQGHGQQAVPMTAMSQRVAEHRVRMEHMLAAPRAHAPATVHAVAAGCIAVLAAAGLGIAQAGMTSALLPPDHTPAPASAGPIMTEHAPEAPAHASPPAPLQLDAPLQTLRVTGHFGDAGGVRATTHRGIDFAARRGTPVSAPADGTVQAATTQYPDGAQYGTVIVLDHGNGWQTLYAHLDRVDVQPGQQVRRGELIGHTGRTGNVTGPHLHMEVLQNGERLDPADLLH